jgi:hypothetical protein
LYPGSLIYKYILLSKKKLAAEHPSNIVAPLPPKPVDVNEVIVKGSGRASKLCVRLKGREHGTY